MHEKRMCDLYFLDHRKHPIMVRQIPALLASGHFEVPILDCCDDATPMEDPQYHHMIVGTAELRLFGNARQWKAASRCCLPSRPSPRAGERQYPGKRKDRRPR